MAYYTCMVDNATSWEVKIILNRNMLSIVVSHMKNTMEKALYTMKMMNKLF